MSSGFKLVRSGEVESELTQLPTRLTIAELDKTRLLRLSDLGLVPRER